MGRHVPRAVGILRWVACGMHGPRSGSTPRQQVAQGVCSRTASGRVRCTGGGGCRGRSGRATADMSRPVQQPACRVTSTAPREAACLVLSAGHTQGPRRRSALSRTPYGAMRSCTGTGLASRLFPKTSIYVSMGVSPPSSAWTYMRSKAATCPLMVRWTMGAHVAVWGS